MEFQLTPEQETIRQRAVDFVQKVCGPMEKTLAAE
jgi:hypothetical protein